MNMPLSAITWRIGKTTIDSIESLLIEESKYHPILDSLKKEFGSIFYLATCQRIVLVSSIDDKRKAIALRDRFIAISGKSINKMDSGEIFVGKYALQYLAELIASLDSIVVGEDQIQYQFKQAYQESEKYLDQNLKQILQHIIRIGKRIRSRTILREGKTSMMSLILQIFEDQLRKANSIGILGTGKMAQAIINVTSQVNQSLSVYSRKSERIGISMQGIQTRDFCDLQSHDILFTATVVGMPLITKDIIGHLFDSPVIIFDLGIPRNCSLEIDDLPHVRLVGIEDLLKLSHRSNLSNDLTNVYRVLQEEIHSVLNTIIKKQKDPYYVSLRADLLHIAMKYQEEFVKSDPQAEIKYQQFINRLIHVSQKHLQNVLSSSDRSI